MTETKRTREELKAEVCARIDRYRDEIIALGEAIYRKPELGYKEQATAQTVACQFENWNLSYESGLAVTGVKSRMRGGSAGPTVAILGELDSIIVPKHPDCDPATGAAHACGHNAQIAMMLGTGFGLNSPDILDALAGDIVLFAVPAEEYVEIGYRSGLRNGGQIEFLGGKQELVKLGAFDDIDMAMMVHLGNRKEDEVLAAGGTSNGFVAKTVKYHGRAAHAAGAPDKGINALSAAHVALAAINAQRETFRDDDAIRVHPIITHGGDIVNVIPDYVEMETYVRGKTAEAIKNANAKTDRALKAGAMALGARVEIDTLPGYLPMQPDPLLADLFKQNALALAGESGYRDQANHGAGSTDTGDLSQLMPVIQPSAASVSGAFHGADYRVIDQEAAYIIPAKVMAMTVIDLLAEGATIGKDLLAQFTPNMTKEEYLAFLRSLTNHEVYGDE